jgi:putative heme iron utilization protein
MVSMVAYAPSAELSAFYMLTSELAQHTQDMRRDSNVSLLITEADDGRDDPLTLARISIRGQAAVLPVGQPGYTPARSLYLASFPRAAPLFEFGDFELWQITARGGRFIAGFGKAFNLTPEALGLAAQVLHEEDESQPDTAG